MWEEAPVKMLVPFPRVNWRRGPSVRLTGRRLEKDPRLQVASACEMLERGV